MARIIPQELGEIDSKGYQLVDRNGDFSLLKTHKGSFTIFYKAWEDGERCVLLRSNEDTARAVFASVEKMERRLDQSLRKPHYMEGKTYEEIYGDETARRLRNARKGYKRTTSKSEKRITCPVCGIEMGVRGYGLHRRMHEKEREFVSEEKCLNCGSDVDYGGSRHFCKKCKEALGSGEKLSIFRKYYSSLPGVREEMSSLKKESLIRNPETHPFRILAGAGKSKRFASFPQCVLLRIVRVAYPEAELNFPVNTGQTVRYVDVAVPSLKVGFEYDGSYYHDAERDRLRDQELREVGWLTIRVSGREQMSYLEESLT